jgi:1,4-dihydroxy-2-naphthoyl-CoA synthase
LIGIAFVLACDMRFASRENTRLGQPEVGVGVNPGGGATERLPLLVGRGRALEIVLGANDFDGETALPPVQSRGLVLSDDEPLPILRIVRRTAESSSR